MTTRMTKMLTMPKMLHLTFETDASDHVERIDDIAQGLGHFAPVSIADHRVEVDFFEGNVA